MKYQSGGMLRDCSRSALLGRAGNLRWEGASWVTAVRVIFLQHSHGIPFINLQFSMIGLGKSSPHHPASALVPGWCYQHFPSFLPKEDAERFIEGQQC